MGHPLGCNVFSGVERANNWTGVFVNDIESQIFTLDTKLEQGWLGLVGRRRHGADQ